MDGGDSYREEFAELAALRAKADRVCAGMRATIAEWRLISEMSKTVRLTGQTVKNEARHVRAQTRLAVMHARHSRNPIAHRLGPGDFGAAVCDHLLAHKNNLGGEGDAFAGGDASLA